MGERDDAVVSHTDATLIGADWAPVHGPQQDAAPLPTIPLIDAINRSTVVVILWRIAEGWPVEFVSENISQWGYTSAELYRGEVAWVQMGHPDDVLWLEKEVEEFFHQRTPSFSHTYRIITRAGEIRWVQDHTIACFDTAGNITHYQGIIHDVTDRVLAEQARLHLEEQLRQAQRLEAIGRLAGGIAHDFNNLLTPIIGFAEHGLTHTHDPAQLQLSFTQIHDAAQRAATLTRQLLAFSRKQVLEIERLDLSAVINDFATMLRTLLGDGIELRLCLDREAGCIEADLAQIQQVIMNLAVNARDAMPEGGVLEIATARLPVDGQGDSVRLSVRDTGCGIDNVTQQYIFEPFFTTKGYERGTGLGLATVYGIVEQHHGRITVESAPGEGAAFHIDFPWVAGEGVHKAPVIVPEAIGSDIGKTVLVVEDADAVRALVTAVLKQQGYAVLSAHHAEEALRIAASYQGTIHLLLTDVVMPKMNGQELARHFQRLRPDTAVIFMSGYVDTEMAPDGVLEPGLRFLRKPFTTDALLHCVHAALAERLTTTP